MLTVAHCGERIGNKKVRNSDVGAKPRMGHSLLLFLHSLHLRLRLFISGCIILTQIPDGHLEDSFNPNPKLVMVHDLKVQSLEKRWKAGRVLYFFLQHLSNALE
jgi:hypothetical protein